MHKDTLPLKVDPFRFAENAVSLNGALFIKEMQRFCSSLASDQGEVKVSMTFDRDEQGIRHIKGRITTEVMLQCQRCLRPFKHEIINEFLLGIVHTEEEADRLPNRYDPLIVSDGALVISDMIEEELIISLPLVPMHNTKDCNAEVFHESSAHEVSVERASPFKVIESLRSKRKKI